MYIIIPSFLTPKRARDESQSPENLAKQARNLSPTNSQSESYADVCKQNHVRSVTLPAGRISTADSNTKRTNLSLHSRQSPFHSFTDFLYKMANNKSNRQKGSSSPKTSTPKSQRAGNNSEAGPSARKNEKRVRTKRGKRTEKDHVKEATKESKSAARQKKGSFSIPKLTQAQIVANFRPIKPKDPNHYTQTLPTRTYYTTPNDGKNGKSSPGSPPFLRLNRSEAKMTPTMTTLPQKPKGDKYQASITEYLKPSLSAHRSPQIKSLIKMFDDSYPANNDPKTRQRAPPLMSLDVPAPPTCHTNSVNSPAVPPKVLPFSLQHDAGGGKAGGGEVAPTPVPHPYQLGIDACKHVIGQIDSRMQAIMQEQTNLNEQIMALSSINPGPVAPTIKQQWDGRRLHLESQLVEQSNLKTDQLKVSNLLQNPQPVQATIPLLLDEEPSNKSAAAAAKAEKIRSNQRTVLPPFL